VRRNISKKLHPTESNHTACVKLDGLLENRIFYTSSKYEFHTARVMNDGLGPFATFPLHRCDLIVHAGDVGSPDVLDALRGLAPTFAVRGNLDTASWAARLHGFRTALSDRG
jgi:Calcineurin-like phosphoesterase superfamily domain